MTIHCRVITFLSADTSRDLVILTSDYLILNSYHIRRVTWTTLSPSLKTPRLSVLELWVMRRITWPVCRGSKTNAYLESSTPLCLSINNFYWAPTTIKGRLLSNRTMLKPFLGEKNCAVKMGPRMAVQTLDIGFATPKRHFLARNRVVWRILRQNRCARFCGSLSQEPPPKKKNNFVTKGAKSRMRRTETPKPIWIKFCMVVDITDIVNIFWNPRPRFAYSLCNFGGSTMKVIKVTRE